MKPITVLHTIETGGPGGAETVLATLASGLDPQRFRSIVLLPETGWLYDQLRAKNVETELVEWKRWYDFRLPRAMISLIRRKQVDVIHSHLPWQNFYSTVVGTLVRRPVVTTYHGGIELDDAQNLKQAVRLWTVRRQASSVTVVCRHVAQMLEKLRFPPEKITCIYNGIRLNGLPARGRLRPELGLPESAKIVGMVANIRRSKGYDHFVRAAKEIVAVMPDVHFVAVGDLDPVLSKPILELTRELGLEQRISFLGFRQDARAILGDFDVFVLSSTSEGMPLVILEAMAAQRPVVTTYCGGPAEVVADEVDGFIVPVGDVAALSGRILQLLRDPALAGKMGAAGRAQVEQRFTIQRMISNYEELYTRLAAR